MRTTGLRVVLLSALGIPIFYMGVLAGLGAPGPRQVAVAIVLGGGGSVLLWLAVGSRQVRGADWLATGVVGLTAFGLSLTVWPEERLWRGAVFDGVFWWCAAVLAIVPASQAVRAIRRARQVARDAPPHSGDLEGIPG